MLHLENRGRIFDFFSQRNKLELLKVGRGIVALTPKIGRFQTGFSILEKYFGEISNIFLASWVLHLKDHGRIFDFFLSEIC